MQNKHELAYERKGLSRKARHRADKEKLTQEISEANNNNIKGQAQHEATVRPMRATGQTAYSTHSTGVFRGYIHGLHDHFLTVDSGSAEQQAIQNDMLPIFNSNSPGQGEPLASNGSRVLMDTNNRTGVATAGNIRNLRASSVSSPAPGPMIGIGGGDFRIANASWGGAASAANIPNNPSSNRITGKEFIVNGVKYNSLPADDAATKAQALRDAANAAGQAAYLGGQKGKWDGSDVGRDWVKQNIYLPVIKLSPGTYPNPERSATEFANKLATNNESFWSSWFFRRCYEAYWNEDSASRTKGLDSSTVFDYTADDGIKLRQKIEASPDSYKGQTVFVAFRNTEAPVFVGDALWNARLSTPNTFEGAAAPGAAHMKVITREEGGGYRAIGGNEGKYSTVNDVPVEVDADKLLTGRAKSLYPVVYKRVTVVGAEAGGEVLASN